MQIFKSQEPKKWDEWLIQVGQSCFGQSWHWGEILSSEGYQVERLLIWEDEVVLAQAQIIYHILPLGIKYAFCPQGPIFSSQSNASLKVQTMIALSQYLRRQNCVFFRLEPSGSALEAIKSEPFFKTKKTSDINPRATVILDLTVESQNILNNFKSKTRYNIKLAEKKGVKMTEKKDLKVFMRLSQATAKRDGFRLHPASHYEQVLLSPLSRQFSAVYEDKEIATIILAGFGQGLTYLYGASDYNYRHLMAPYFLQWQALIWGKKTGYHYYDFFGIAPGRVIDGQYDYDSAHRYAGVTRFKTGFGGQIQIKPGTFDMIFNSFKYIFYKLSRKIRRFF